MLLTSVVAIAAMVLAVVVLVLGRPDARAQGDDPGASTTDGGGAMGNDGLTTPLDPRDARALRDGPHRYTAGGEGAGTRTATSRPGRTSGRPNIVLISTDDMAASDLRYMPKTRRLIGDSGTQFTQALSPHPLCCPARAEMITGQFAQNNGVHSNGGPYGGLPALIDPDNTLPAWLKAAGYHTGMSGKYLNKYKADTGVPAGWDFWNASIYSGFGYYDYSMYNNGQGLSRYTSDDGILSTDLIAQNTVDLIDAWSGRGKPFFLWSSYYAPHGVCGTNEGCTAPPDYAPETAGMFETTRPASTRSPAYNEDDVSDKPDYLANRAQWDDQRVTDLFRARLRSLASVDDGVARTVRALERNGQLANTLLVFTSDNGYLLGEHRYVGKVVPYEEALRVPLLISGPGVARGALSEEVATLVDLAPTFVQAAGATPGRLMDGRPLQRLLTPALTRTKGDASDRTRAPAETTVLIQGGPNAADPDPRTPWLYRGLRTQQYTYVDWTDRRTELYDRRTDPYQLDNLALNPRYDATLRELDRRLRQTVDCRGPQDCFRNTGAPPGPATTPLGAPASVTDPTPRQVG